jgi:predicted molibdopterin-dependent oxidoreductase YjgC
VDIVSRRGRIQDVELRVTEAVAPGQLFVPFHYFEANANQVTQSAFDPISREPNYKQSAVRVEAAGRDSGLGTRGSRGTVESRIPDRGSRILDRGSRLRGAR